jgi:hypothetical protein
MTRHLDGEATRQELAQFEPDPDGIGSRDERQEAAAMAAHPLDDAPWIAFTDQVGESDWAAVELQSIGGFDPSR